MKKIALIYLTLLSLLAKGVRSTRPELTLLNVLARPFAPTKSANASDECLRDSGIYFAALKEYSPWALKMYDASAKIPSGIITGNIEQLGDYDECLQINTGHEFLPQACSASVQFKLLEGRKNSEELDMKDLFIKVAAASNLRQVPSDSPFYEWMWCVPSTCNHLEVSDALELALNPLKVDDRFDFDIHIDSSSCHTSATDDNNFDALDWTYVAILVIFGCIIFSSTAYDLSCSKCTEVQKKDSTHLILTSFSLYTNSKELFSTKRHGSAIGCLDGLRFFSMCWIICGHTFYQEAVGVKANRSSITKMHESWSSMLILNGNIVTDTFFLISGILLAYTSLLKSSKDANATLNVPSLYLNRYFRLTPAYAIIIGFYATLFNKVGSGPKWNTWVNVSKLDCRANWWTNLLYINNYLNIDHICLSQSWYLAVDMQLLWLSPIFLYPLLKFNRSHFFWIITIFGLLVSVIVPFFVTYTMHLTATMLYYKNLVDLAKVYVQIYVNVYTRAGPYIIGISLGYILYKTKSYKFRIPKPIVVFGWIVATIGAVSVVVGPRNMYFEDHLYSEVEASFYAGLHRHIFAVCVAWVIFASAHGYAGPVNSLLSWNAWIPMSKLSYCAYLSHFIILLYRSGSARTSGSLTKFDSFHSFLGNLALTMLISIVLSLSFEMPFMVLVRLFLGKRPRNLVTKPSAESIISSIDNQRKIDNVSSEESIVSVYTIDDKSFDKRNDVRYDKSTRITINE